MIFLNLKSLASIYPRSNGPRVSTGHRLCPTIGLLLVMAVFPYLCVEVAADFIFLEE